MGQKITSNLFERSSIENSKYKLYMFMMKLIGERIYRKEYVNKASI